MKKEGGLGGKRYKVSYPHPNTCETSIQYVKDQTGDLSLRKPRTSQLSHDFAPFAIFYFTKLRDIQILFLTLSSVSE